jgi:hypothetical protein
MYTMPMVIYYQKSANQHQLNEVKNKKGHLTTPFEGNYRGVKTFPGIKRTQKNK